MKGDLREPVKAPTTTEPPMESDKIRGSLLKGAEGQARVLPKTFDEYDEDDARAMSPRRSAAELEIIGSEAKALLEKQARDLQSGLLDLLERVDKVKEEHQKLEAENRFLQEYIGSLMATSKITGPSSHRSSRSGMGRVK